MTDPMPPRSGMAPRRLRPPMSNGETPPMALAHDPRREADGAAANAVPPRPAGDEPVTLAGAVGPAAANRPEDVLAVKDALVSLGRYSEEDRIAYGGSAEPEFFATLGDFQLEQQLRPDRLAQPGGPTEAALNHALGGSGGPYGVLPEPFAGEPGAGGADAGARWGDPPPVPTNTRSALLQSADSHLLQYIDRQLAFEPAQAALLTPAEEAFGMRFVGRGLTATARGLGSQAMVRGAGTMLLTAGMVSPLAPAAFVILGFALASQHRPVDEDGLHRPLVLWDVWDAEELPGFAATLDQLSPRDFAILGRLAHRLVRATPDSPTSEIGFRDAFEKGLGQIFDSLAGEEIGTYAERWGGRRGSPQTRADVTLLKEVCVEVLFDEFGELARLLVELWGGERLKWLPPGVEDHAPERGVRTPEGQLRFPDLRFYFKEGDTIYEVFINHADARPDPSAPLRSPEAREILKRAVLSAESFESARKDRVDRVPWSGVADGRWPRCPAGPV